MQTTNSIRVVVFKDGDQFIAQGLEVDICAFGSTAEEADLRFGVTLRAEQREAEQGGRSLFDIGPAPAAFYALHDNAVIDRSVSQVA